MAALDDRLRYGLVLPNWEAGSNVIQLVEAAVVAEEAGWDGVFLADHLIFPPPSELGGPSTNEQYWPMPDPWMTLAGIATRTHNVTLGTWVTPVARRQPWQLARDLATLDRLSKGRVLLGVGLGRRPDYEQFGRVWDWKTIASQTDEALDLIARLWTGDRVTHVGDHYTVVETALLPTPIQQPRIPIVIGGLWPRKPAVRRGARWDGIMTHFPGDGVLPSDDTSPEQHATDMVGYYHSLTDTPGEVFLPAFPERASHGWMDVVTELGRHLAVHGQDRWHLGLGPRRDQRWSANGVRRGPNRYQGWPIFEETAGPLENECRPACCIDVTLRDYRGGGL